MNVKETLTIEEMKTFWSNIFKVIIKSYDKKGKMDWKYKRTYKNKEAVMYEVISIEVIMDTLKRPH